MRKGPAAALAALVLLFGLITVTRMRSQPGAAPGVSRADSNSSRAGVREFWEVYRRATDERVAGRMAEARDAYRQALALDPRHEDALYYLGNVELDLGHYQDAGSAWERLLQLNPSSSRTHSRLGDLYACIEAGAPTDLARAEAEFRRALALNREETGPLLRLGEVALVRGRLAGAIAYFDTVIGFHPRSVEAQFLKGYALWKQGQPAPAAALFRQAVASAHLVQSVPSQPGEGDTKRGPAWAIAETSRCHIFEGPVGELAGVDGASLSTRMPGFYRRLDARLAALTATAR
jgi:tetratricopeptide (TPR) repeat protein